MRIRQSALAILALTAASVPAAAHQDRVPRNARQCISPDGIRGETAESDEELIFHVGGGRAYISYLPKPCDGLRALNNVGHVSLHQRGEDLCVGDSVTLKGDGILSAVGIGGDDTPDRCTLGPFAPVTEMTLSEGVRLP
jgi:hypothetical protein